MPPLNLPAIQSAATLLAQTRSDDMIFLHQLPNAVKKLLKSTWSYSPKGVLTITSATKKNVSYTTSGNSCTCEAVQRWHRRWCWHQIAWHILLIERVAIDPYCRFHRR